MSTAEPRIYTKNYVNADGVNTISHGSSAFANAYDGDKDSQWVSSGANSDSQDVTLEIEFYEGSRAIDRTIDRLILVNHNLKDYLIEYWDGSAWQTWLNVTGDVASTTIQTLTEHTISKMRLTAHTTQSVNAEKAIGEMIVCALQLDPARDLSVYEVVFSENASVYRSGDGGVQKQVKRFSPNRFEKYEARVAFDFLSESVLDSFYSIKKNGLPFLWQPESVSRPDEIYYVNWTDAFKYKYLSQNKGAGFHLEFTVTEV